MASSNDQKPPNLVEKTVEEKDIGTLDAQPPLDITRRALSYKLSLRSRLRNSLAPVLPPDAVNTTDSNQVANFHLDDDLNPNTFKCILAGPSGSGKTSLLMRLKFRNFMDVTVPTIGCNIAITPSPKTGINLCNWDMGNGLEGAAQIHASSTRGADAMIFVVDIVTFLAQINSSNVTEQNDAIRYREEARKSLWNYFRQIVFRKTIVLVLANQTDRISDMQSLGDISHKISEALALHLAGNCHVEVRYCSVKTGHNFKESISWLVNAILGLRSMLKQGALIRPQRVNYSAISQRKLAPRTPPQLMLQRKLESNDSIPSSTSMTSIAVAMDNIVLPKTSNGLSSSSSASSLTKLKSMGYANSEMPTDCFRQQLKSGILARFDFQDAARIIFHLANDVIFNSKGVPKIKIKKKINEEIDLDEIDQQKSDFYSRIFFLLHSEVASLFRLPGSLLDNATATRILIDEVVSTIQRFLISNRRRPYDSEFSRRILGLHHLELSTVETTIWRNASPEFLFSNTAINFILEPDLSDPPCLWCIPCISKEIITNTVNDDNINEEQFSDFEGYFYGLPKNYEESSKIKHIDFLNVCYTLIIKSMKNKEEKETMLKGRVELQNYIHDNIFNDRFCWTEIIVCINLIEVAISFNEDIHSGDLTFPNFALFFPRLAHSSYWKKHYTEKNWRKAKVSKEFVMPDKHPVPNVFTREEIKIASSIPKLERLFKNILPETFNEVIGRERLFPLAPDTISHVDFLFLIFDHICLKKNKSICKNSIKKEENNLSEEKKENKNILLEKEFSTAESVINLSAMLCVLYDQTSRSKPTKIPTGMTHLYFWITIVSVCQIHFKRFTNFSSEISSSFNKFLKLYPALLWPDLWSQYYTIECMWGAEGLSYCLEPDVCSIPSLHIQNPNILITNPLTPIFLKNSLESINETTHVTYNSIIKELPPLPE